MRAESAVASTLVMLRKRGQRIPKAVHVVAAGAWLGALAAMVPVLAGHQTPGQRAGLDLAAYRIHEFILFYAFIATLVTGLLFSLFTQWGFFKHHWITSKWLLALVLFAITRLWQSPSLSGLVALSDAGLDHIHGYHHAQYRLASLRLAAIQLAIVVQNRDAHYARIAEAVLPRIIAAQNANVDAITGATTTSKCLMRAVEDADQAKPSSSSAR